MSRAELLNVPVPKDERVYRATPVRDIFETADRLSRQKGWTLTGEHLNVKSEGKQQMIRLLYNTPNPRFFFELAVLNSYNKTIALKAAAGASVRVCWNGMCAGEFGLSHKHVGDVNEDLLTFMEGFFTEQESILNKAETMWTTYSEVELEEKEENRLIGELFMKDLINTEQLNLVKKSYFEPVDYGINPHSLNQMYQNVTMAQRNTHPLEYEKIRVKTESFFEHKYAQFN
jgi:hypothetical protein